MNTDVLASYTQKIARGPAITLNNDSRINAVYSGRLPVRVGWYHGRGWDWLNVPIFRDYYWPARSATRVYWQQEGPMFSYSLYVVCCLYVTFLLPLERATKAGPCHLFFSNLNEIDHSYTKYEGKVYRFLPSVRRTGIRFVIEFLPYVWRIGINL